jgi:hypothetical protein
LAKNGEKMKDSIEKNSPVPLYKQLKHIIENQIKSGQKKPGELIYFRKRILRRARDKPDNRPQGHFELVNATHTLQDPAERDLHIPRPLTSPPGAYQDLRP